MGWDKWCKKTLKKQAQICKTTKTIGLGFVFVYEEVLVGNKSRVENNSKNRTQLLYQLRALKC